MWRLWRTSKASSHSQFTSRKYGCAHRSMHHATCGSSHSVFLLSIFLTHTYPCHWQVQSRNDHAGLAIKVFMSGYAIARSSRWRCWSTQPPRLNKDPDHSGQAYSISPHSRHGGVNVPAMVRRSAPVKPRASLKQLSGWDGRCKVVVRPPPQTGRRWLIIRIIRYDYSSLTMSRNPRILHLCLSAVFQRTSIMGQLTVCNSTISDLTSRCFRFRFQGFGSFGTCSQRIPDLEWYDASPDSRLDRDWCHNSRGDLISGPDHAACNPLS